MKGEQRLRRVVPLNVDADGDAKTVCAGYYKYGVQTLLTGDYGTTGTIVLEIADQRDAGGERLRGKGVVFQECGADDPDQRGGALPVLRSPRDLG